MKKTALLILAVLLLGALLCGCGKADSENKSNSGEEIQIPEIKEPTDDDIKDSIVGAWVGEENGQKLGYIFNEDGTGTAAIFPMTYTVEDGIITVTIEAFGKVETGSARYSMDGDTIVIETEDGEYVLQRTEMPK